MITLCKLITLSLGLKMKVYLLKQIGKINLSAEDSTNRQKLISPI